MRYESNTTIKSNRLHADNHTAIHRSSPPKLTSSRVFPSQIPAGVTGRRITPTSSRQAVREWMDRSSRNGNSVMSRWLMGTWPVSSIRRPPPRAPKSKQYCAGAGAGLLAAVLPVKPVIDPSIPSRTSTPLSFFFPSYFLPFKQSAAVFACIDPALSPIDSRAKIIHIRRVHLAASTCAVRRDIRLCTRAVSGRVCCLSPLSPSLIHRPTD